MESERKTIKLEDSEQLLVIPSGIGAAAIITNEYGKLKVNYSYNHPEKYTKIVRIELADLISIVLAQLLMMNENGIKEFGIPEISNKKLVEKLISEQQDILNAKETRKSEVAETFFQYVVHYEHK